VSKKAPIRDRVEASQKKRAAMVARLGCVPHSVLKLNRGALSRSMFCYQQERPDRRGGTAAYTASIANYGSEESEEAQRIREKEKIAGAGYSRNPSKDRMAASIMAAELVDFFARYYSAPGEVYVDPFMGQGVQLQVAWLLGIHYRGMDLSEDFFAYIEAVRDRLLAIAPDRKDPPEALVLNGDSRFLEGIPDGEGDFCFTSPPYWDIEWYGSEEEQLGTGQTYEDFLAGMEEVAVALRRKMKPGAFAVINVNDFRRGGDFYPYHADTISLFRRAGWKVHDIWIIEGLIGGLPKVFGVKSNTARIAPKVHEYGLVFRA